VGKIVCGEQAILPHSPGVDGLTRDIQLQGTVYQFHENMQILMRKIIKCMGEPGLLSITGTFFVGNGKILLPGLPAHS